MSAGSGLPSTIGRSFAQLQNTWNQLKSVLQKVPRSEGGVAEVEADGVNRPTKITTVTHNLGIVPTDIQLTAQRSEVGVELMEPVEIQGSRTATQFKIRGLGGVVFSAGVKVPINWRAFVD